ncbi:hypothetical protein GYMLUDRAFT_55742 [Collybiopsis luxurians FD-317 M1]|nr:hypothetical protein GYMLUDRAFT_55742 [Collybiopsis luxurians FD-317 M1]
MAQVKDTDYFDIANVDHYYVVLGTVFMRKHGISLNFEQKTVRKPCITVAEIKDDDSDKNPSFSYLLPVLLDPEDKVTVEDMDKLIDEVTMGKFADPNFNRNSHEMQHLVHEFTEAKQ